MRGKFRQLFLASALALAWLLATPMLAAVDVETGQFAATTSGTTQNVPASFTGKTIIFWGTQRTATGASAANGSFSVGFSDGTNHAAIGVGGDNAVATSNVGRWDNTARALDLASNGTPTKLVNISGVSFSSTQFTVTWSGTPAAAYLINYMLVGGSDITNVLVGTNSLPAGVTGSASETGVGFQPTFVMTLFAQSNGTTAGTSLAASVGLATSSAQSTFAVSAQDAQTMSANVNGDSYVNSSAFISGLTMTGDTVDTLASFTSMDTDGFTYNVSNAPTSNSTFYYLAIKGGQWAVGTSAKPTTATTQTASGLAFTPKGMFIGITNAVTSGTLATGGATLGMGAAVSTSTEAYSGFFHNDAINTVVRQGAESTKILAEQANTTVQADYTSFGASDWTITWGAGGTAYLCPWFALGDNAVAPTCAGTRALMGVGC